MHCRLDIQSKIWKGNAAAARKLGDPYKFYRLHGTTKKPKYDSGLQYGRSVKYGDRNGQDTGSFDDGRVYDVDTSPAIDPENFDTPGARMDQGNAFDETNPANVDETKYDDTVNFDEEGFRWDQPGNLVAELPVSLNAQDMNYRKPNGYGKPIWYALLDGNALQVGDYFIGPGGTFFIATMQKLLPILAVECNRVISLYRPQRQTGKGLVGYGGTTDKNMTLLRASRPCSILQGTKGEKSEANLPGDTRAAWWSILLPDSGIIIRPDDIGVDDLNRRYVISSPELSDAGWRCTAQMALT
jgi:hypothetical protein